MKRWLSYLFMAALCCMAAVSCIEESIEECLYSADAPVLKLKIHIPGGAGTRASGTYTTDPTYQDNLDPQTETQRYIGGTADDPDVMVLQFKAADSTLFHVVNDLKIKGQNGADIRELTGTLLKTEGEAYIVVLTNLHEQGIDTTSTNFFTTYKNKTETEIYKELIYTYPDTTWDLESRKLPMWGKTKSFSLKRKIYTDCDLYRAVAKMGVQVAETCQSDFKLKEVYVYYINEKGYCAAPTQQPDPDKKIQYTKPDIPACGQRGKDKPLIYTVGDYPEDAPGEPVRYVIHDTAFLNQIYLPEADNQPGGPGELAMKIVVGGVYKKDDPDNTTVTYYRIDLKDDKDNTGGEKKPYDIIRNHSYIFNITGVTGPGTPTPEEALPHLIVKIEDWTEVFMRSVPDQYTLTVDHSVFKFPASKAYANENLPFEAQKLKISTDLGEGWKIEEKGNCDWFTISAETGPEGETEITVTPTENFDVTREGSFYVVAGNIRKEIRVIQRQPETANCYVVGEGEHNLIVTIRGDGMDGLIASGGVSLIPGKPNPTLQDKKDYVTMRPAKVGLIWETAAGLVKLINPADGTVVSNTEGSMTYVDLPADENVIKYKVDIDGSGASIGGIRGGNALIGAFDANNKVLWSWHIWVAPDIIDPETQQIKDEHVERWKVNDYDLLDRNLGALSNRPNESAGENEKGVAAQGLLYQWGRKDPFIGANYSKGGITLTNKGLLPVVHYYKVWNVLETSFDDGTIPATIADPTLLVHHGTEKEGMVDIPGYGQHLWGVEKGLEKQYDPGIKTIYDPSPVGYRVPPTDLFVFKLFGEGEEWHKGAFIETITINKGESSYVKEYGSPVYWEYEEQSFIGTNKYDGTAEDGRVTISPPTSYFAGSSRTYEIYHAFSGRKEIISSETTNWRLNLVYVPHYSETSYSGTQLKPNTAGADDYQWGNYYDFYTVTGDRQWWIYAGDYIKDADYYGFYLDYIHKTHEPLLTSTTRTGHNNSGTARNYYYELSPQEDNCSWFPITAVYDPTLDDPISLEAITIQTGASVTVNSFLWTNSTVKKKAGGYGPGAMFLHGAEDPDHGGNGHPGSGRHIHWLTDTEIYAEPQYAGSVRSIRDRPKTLWEENSLTKEASIAQTAGATTTLTLISVSGTWKLVTPGAPWLKVTPDSGPATGGDGSASITLTMRQVDSQPVVGTTTKLVFQIEGENEKREVTVTVVQ